MESTYHGVPLLGMPIYADQFGNIRKAEAQGWARMFKWDHLNEENFTIAINNILSDKK